MPTAYLDHAASTPMRDEVRAAMLDAFGAVGNASSLHASGRHVRRLVEESRESIAGQLGVRPSEIIFTAGGTEADNLAVKGLWWARNQGVRRPRVLASAVEHHAVLDPVEWLASHEGAQVTWLPVDGRGAVDPGVLERELGDGSDVALVTVMWANNEVGTINDIAALSAICAERGVPFVSDAVQAVGRIPVDASLASCVAASGHKIGGPHGVGLLTATRGLDLTAVLHGGGQDRARSGTYDVPGIVGFAAAMQAATMDMAEQAEALADLRDHLVAAVAALDPTAVLNGADPGAGRLPGNAHFSFPGCEGDALLMLLDAAGVECSTGSACTSGVPQPSHVLTAMGISSALSRGSLRFSLGWTSTRADVDALVTALPGALERARRAGLVRLGAFDGIDPAALGGIR